MYVRVEKSLGKAAFPGKNLSRPSEAMVLPWPRAPAQEYAAQQAKGLGLGPGWELGAQLGRAKKP